MFLRVFYYRLLAKFREVSSLFWMLIFPYILAVIFSVAIMPMGELKFEPLKVAVVTETDGQANEANKAFFESISKPESENRLLDITCVDEAAAVDLLNKFEITGFFAEAKDGKLELSVNRSEIDQTILRSIADSYNQISAVITKTISENPEQAQATLESLDWVDTEKFYKDNPFREEGNPTAVYFFALIGMVIMYAMNFTINEVTYLQGDLSAQGARVLVSPASKGTLMLASLGSSFLIQMLNSAALMVFLEKVIGFKVLHFGLPLWALLAVGNLAAVAMGACLTTYVKGGFDVKISVAISISMICSFFAGMMNDGIRFMVINSFPVLSRLNPAELIADSFYAMYFFSDQSRVWENCLILGAITLVLAIASVFKIRRSDYASI